MEMAAVPPDSSLKLDGCNILPLIEGTSEKVIQADGKERDTLFWFYPLESHMAVVMRQAGWKLVNNLGVGYAGKWADVENKQLIELFQIKKGEQQSADLGEQTNLANKFPKIRDAMLSEMDEFLNNAKVSMPYRNINSPEVPHSQKQAYPKI